jgi:enoyl-CoA hydratase/carnithine racemase
MKPGMPAKVFEMASSLMAALRKSPVPIVAAVNGLAAASGCQLVAACDIVICTEKSSFSTPGLVGFGNNFAAIILKQII